VQKGAGVALQSITRVLWSRIQRGVPFALIFALMAGMLMPLGVREVAAVAPMDGPGLVYFPITGHNVAGDFLDFWHENGSIERIGYPVSEEVRDGAGAKQYFERGIIQYVPGGGLTFGRLGAEAASGRRESAFRPLTRGDFGADRPGRRFFSPVGHGITGTFGKYWDENGGVAVFGYPVSEPLKESVGENKASITVQYFERARMELWGDQVRIANLGREYVDKKALGLGTAPKMGGAVDYSTSIWPKWIDVNLTSQHLVAYEGNTVAQQFDITSGEPANATPPGTFHIFSKLKSEHMKGPGYDIPNVPWTMYFAGGGYAIHGAPWRDVYGAGTERGGSHGCVNSPVGEVAKLYQWAPLGTTVVIHF